MVDIKIENGYLYSKSKYDEKIISFMRSRPKRFWDASNRQWRLPEDDLELFLKVLEGYEYEVTYVDGSKPNIYNEYDANKLSKSSDASKPKITEETKQIIIKDVLPKWYKFKTKPYAHQIDGVNYGLQHPKFLLGDEPGLGKALDLNTKVYTPDGCKLMKDIEVGDYVFNKQGNPVIVLATYNHENVNMCRITFSDGVYIDCCEDHLWEIYAKRRKKIVDTKWFFGNDKCGNPRSDCKTESGYYKYYIDNCNPVEFNEHEVFIDPYVLGCILGDGNITNHSIKITTPDDEICSNISNRLKNGYILNPMKSIGYGECPEYLIVKENTKSSKENLYVSYLKEIGLYGKDSHTKFIPDEYKYNSISNRIDLLRGLIDTDGYSSKDNLLQYTTVSKQLALDVRFIIESLGGFVSFSEKQCGYNGKVTGTAYTLTIKCNDPSLFCSLTRKKEKLGKRKFKPRRKIVSVEKLGKGNAKCITVDDKDGLYLIDHFIVTHNTKQLLDISQILKADKGVKHVLIIACVNSLKYNWQAEVGIHTNDKGFILGTRYSKNGTEKIGSNEDRLKDIESLGENKTIDSCYYLITNIETLRYNKSIKVPLKTKKNGVQRFKKQTVFPIVDAIQSQIDKGNIGMIICDESHKCLSYDTLVETDKGLIKIGDIVNNQCYLIKTLNDNGTISFVKPVNYFTNPIQPYMLELTIQLENGNIKKIVCTSDHKFLTKNRGYVEAINLNFTDEVVEFD